MYIFLEKIRRKKLARIYAQCTPKQYKEKHGFGAKASYHVKNKTNNGREEVSVPQHSKSSPGCFANNGRENTFFTTSSPPTGHVLPCEAALCLWSKRERSFHRVILKPSWFLNILSMCCPCEQALCLSSRRERSLVPHHFQNGLVGL